MQIGELREERVRTERARPLIEAAGVVDARQVAMGFGALLGLPIFAIAADRLLMHLRKAGRPGQAMLAFQEAVERMEASRGDASPLFVEPILGVMIELAGASSRGARMLSSDPALAVEFGARLNEPSGLEGDDPKMRPDPLGALVARAGADTERFDRLLRRYRNSQMLRIALRELRGEDVRSTAAELADLASGAMQAALDHHLPLVQAKLGAPDPPCEHVVIGMGKLGGRELNFSSDIDVIYLYEHDEGTAGEASMHQFHVKLFSRVTQSLSKITEHGFVFRVDLDLRPEGKTGPLANSLISAERYYETWGRTWERAAWIKARPIAGSLAMGAKIAGFIRPFVYRRSLDFKAIDELGQMKAKIDSARKRAALKKINAGLDLKLGRGGIREIEFFAQAHQLLRGGRDQRLRETNTLEALQSLEAAGWVNAKTRETLSDAYLLFRKVEHRLQIAEEQQTHTIPERPEVHASLARSLGYADAESFLASVGAHMDEVHAIFEALLGSDQEEEVPASIELLLDTEAEESERLEVVLEAGAREPYASLAHLEASARQKGPFHPHATLSQQKVGQLFLAECLESPSVDRALRHLPDLIKRLSLHRSYLELLGRPSVRRGVARVLGASDLLARILVSSPALLTEVLVAKELPSLTGLRIEVADEIEFALAELRTIKQKEVLRTAMADLAGVLEVSAVGERLSALADALIEASLQLALREMTERFGAPADPAAKMVVIAGGSLGARELGYRTDVDLAVVYEGQGETVGARRKPVSCTEFFTRVVQRLLAFLSMRMPQGDLYPVDMRLRPSGAQGALVTSLAKFERYHEGGAQLWERQALVRFRSCAGDPELRARVDAALHAAVYDASPVQDVAAKIHQMRQRMEKERSVAVRSRAKEARLVDLKFGTGGLVEVEFLVQYLLIRNGAAHPQIRTTSTLKALAALGQQGILTLEQARWLSRGYQLLRGVLNWLRIAHDEPLDHLDIRPERLRGLALAVGYAGQDAQKHLSDELEQAMAVHHEIYVAKLV